jgi:hypothetical protein
LNNFNLEYFKIRNNVLSLHHQTIIKEKDMEKELVLKTMKEAGKPIAAGEVATLSGLDRKVVDKVFAELKKEGAIVSPVRCKWTPAE